MSGVGRPGEPDLGSPVVVVGVGEVIDRSETCGGEEGCRRGSEDGPIDGGTFVIDGFKELPTQAGVDGEVLGDLPIVLNKSGDVVIAEVALAVRDTAGTRVRGDGFEDRCIVSVVPDVL